MLYVIELRTYIEIDLFLRFPIAMKYPTSNDVGKIDLFLEEAKTMLRIGGYHDYIVNLQGLVCETNGKGDKIPEVSEKEDFFNFCQCS